MVPADDNLINRVVADAAAREQLRQQLAAAPLFDASFVDVIDLTSDLEIGVQPDLPNLPVKLAADLKTKKVVNFQFEKVMQRPMPDELGIQLRLLLEEFKAAHSADYRKHLRPYDLAVSLYYAKEVVLRIESTQQISAEARTEVEGLGGTVKVDATGKQELRFDQSNCPFAVTLKATQTY